MICILSSDGTVFADEIFKIGKNKDFFMSGTMIQPFKSYIELDCGKTFSDFNEEKLLSNFDKISFNDFQGTHWQPLINSYKHME